MHYILLILINLLALNFWLWLFQSIFHRKQHKLFLFSVVLIMGVISAGSLLLYPTLLRYFPVETFTAVTLTRQNIAFLIGYVGIIWLILLVLGRRATLTHKVVIRLLAFGGLATWVALWYLTLPVWVALYFLCIAWAEEFLKLSVWQSFFSQYKISKKDLLLFAILSAIGFSLIENVIYLFTNPNIGLAVSRSLTTVMMHIIFTGSIAYLISTRQHKWRYVVAFLLGMALHRSYNTFVNYNNSWFTALLILWGYFVVSYFLYKSDRLYLK